MTKEKFKEYYETLTHDYKIINAIYDTSDGAIQLFEVFKSIEVLANMFVDEMKLDDDNVFKLLDSIFNNDKLEDIIGRYSFGEE